MDEKLIPVLEYVDRQNIRGVRVELVKSIFATAVVDTCFDLGFISIDKKESGRFYRLTKAGYNILSNSRGRKESKSANKYALTISILALIVAILSLLFAIFH